MKILVITPLSLNVGLAQWTLVDFARSFAERGHAVIIADYTSTAGSPDRVSDTKLLSVLGQVRRVRIQSVGYPLKKLPSVSPAGLRAILPLFDWAEVVVYAQYYASDLLFTVIGRLRHKPTGPTLGNTLQRPRIGEVREGIHRIYMRTLGRLAIVLSTFVRVCNRDDLALLKSWGQSACHLVYPLVPAESEHRELQPMPDSRFRILLGGRTSPQKGFSIANSALLNVARSTQPYDPQIELHLSVDDDVSRTFTILHRPPRFSVINHGLTDREQFVKLLKEADLLLVPSLYESFGKVALEAAAEGVVTIASNVTGLREIVVPNETGFLVPPGDPRLLATRIRECVELKSNNRPAWEAMRRASLHRYGIHFSNQAVGHQLDAWLEGMSASIRPE